MDRAHHYYHRAVESLTNHQRRQRSVFSRFQPTKENSAKLNFFFSYHINTLSAVSNTSQEASKTLIYYSRNKKIQSRENEPREASVNQSTDTNRSRRRLFSKWWWRARTDDDPIVVGAERADFFRHSLRGLFCCCLHLAFATGFASERHNVAFFFCAWRESNKGTQRANAQRESKNQRASFCCWLLHVASVWNGFFASRVVWWGEGVRRGTDNKKVHLNAERE